jgi:hypothetical protein
MRPQAGLLAILMLNLAAGCAQVAGPGYRAREATAAHRAPVAAGELITRLLFDYTPAAQEQVADDDKFSDAALVRTVGQELAAHGLADLASSTVVRVAAIEIDEFDLRPTSNVVMMGRLATRGVLGGTVRIRDGGGTQLRQFHIRAEAAMKVVWNGNDKKGLENLYREFAAQIVDELTGTVRAPKQKQDR